MAEQFLHGVEMTEIDSGPRPIRTVKSSIIGVVGTAPDADASVFPANKPVLIPGDEAMAAKLDPVGDGKGTLPAAMDGIFDQCGAAVVAIRVEEGADADATKSAVIGGVDAATGQYEGIKALLAAQSVAKVTPKILCVPGFSQDAAVATELVAAADRLRAGAILDGPNTNDADAIAFRETLSSARAYLVDPWVRVWDTAANAEVIQPASARVAGIVAKSDLERGFWTSPSNQPMAGIVGTARPIDFVMGDFNCRANLLNENEVASIIQEDGFRLWGNRSCSSDPKWAFWCVRRTADMINESLQKAHLWAVDRGITKTYVEDVTEGVRAYLRSLKERGAILDGDVWVDPALNTPAEISQGRCTWDFDFGPIYPCEHPVFRSRLNNGYVEEIFK